MSFSWLCLRGTWVKTAKVKQIMSQIDVISIKFSSVAQLCPTLCDPIEPHHARPPCSSPSQSPHKPMSIESVMPSNHLILCCPLLLSPSIFPSIRVFPNESVFRIRWPQYWSFSLRISLSNEYSGMISFRMDGLDVLVVQDILKSLLQHHISKASILRHSAKSISHVHT